MLLKVNVHEAKTNLSKLLAQVEEGKEVIIARAGKPVARLVPIERQTAQRIPGSAKGKLVIADDLMRHFEDILNEFEKCGCC
ncbi:type II toxin-antitoxin system Phd/YefM family antitoxin [Acetomicrobium sp.]|uniref:type II toxin-antitoxin system Phd/YefM family antitoxin n=1 Tax=Acetomicrobium sp. TaxID=1872099 RepID=UPI002870BA60|nr:type II toxin-antitoxin system Phd/YefM family antitoxin [Acetomicrobium sp.]MDR9769420.1 type II toxin-antitoxin system Phd/YefM family antitoxin [Acetomicrobium sp.]